MFVPFESISDSSRIWVFQSEKKLTAEEKTTIEENLRQFTDRWQAHGQPLKSSFEIRFDQFIILAADEDHHSPSGCSIDDSVKVLKEVERKLGIKLLDQNQVAFTANEVVFLIPVGSLSEKYADGIWNEGTLTFNNLISSKKGIMEEWIVPAGKTWLKRYIPGLKTVS